MTKILSLFLSLVCTSQRTKWLSTSNFVMNNLHHLCIPFPTEDLNSLKGGPAVQYQRRILTVFPICMCMFEAHSNILGLVKVHKYVDRPLFAVMVILI